MGAPDVGPSGYNHLFIDDLVNEEQVNGDLPHGILTEGLPPPTILLNTDPDITLGLEGLYVAFPGGHVADEILHAEPGVEPSQEEPEASQHELNAPESIPREDMDASLEVHAPSVTQIEVNATVAQAQVEIPKDGLLASPHGIQHDETPQEYAHSRGVCRPTPCQEDIQESGEVAEVTPIQESVSEPKRGDTTSIHQESGETGTHPEESQMKMVQESPPSTNSDTRPHQESTLQPRGSRESDYTENRYGVQRQMFEVSKSEGEQVHRESTTGSVRRVELPTPVVKVPQKDESPIGGSQESDYTENQSGVRRQRFQEPDAKPEERAHDQMTSREKEKEKEKEEVHTQSVRGVEHLTPVKKVPKKGESPEVPQKGESPQTKDPKTEAAQESNGAVHHSRGQAVQESEGAEVGNSDTDTHWQSTDL